MLPRARGYWAGAFLIRVGRGVNDASKGGHNANGEKVEPLTSNFEYVVNLKNTSSAFWKE